MLTIVSPLFSVVSDRLGSLTQNQVDLQIGFVKEMRKLSDTLRRIQFVLEEAEEKHVSNFLQELKDAAYDADDILDELAISIQSKVGTKKVWFSFVSDFKFRTKMSKQLLKLGVRLDELASKLELQVKDKHHQTQQEILSNFSNSKPPILGRDVDKQEIVHLLLDSQDDLFLFPLVATGGMGKTTLSQMVYTDDKVVTYFDVRIWVVVSQHFDLKTITRESITSVTNKECSIQELDLLQLRLREILAAKRFLLVLDDVWSEDPVEWEKFEYAFRCGAKGSSVLITTRLQTVASIAGTCPPYFLSSLSDDECWSLVKHGSFGTGNKENSNLAAIGKEVARKCGGLPLAAVLLGGLLGSKVEVAAWVQVRDSSVWDIEGGDAGISPSVILSYLHLSPQMKLCFTYCAIFPSKYRILSKHLIQLWMANGFLQPRQQLQLEEVGYEILKSLICRSLFQDAEYDEEGKTVSFRMHDLVRELAISVAKDEQFLVSEDWRKTRTSKGKKHFLLRGPRHLLIDFKTTSSSLSSSIVQSIQQSAPNLRTCILSSPLKSEHLSLLDFLNFKSLRVMSMDSIGVGGLPDSLGRLSHLRYLELSHSEIISLPETICDLRNLQTLKLENCFFLERLPKCTRNISSLRHLDIRGCSSLSEMPVGLGQLVFLQTLSIFIVGSGTGRHINELQGLDKLTGELMLKGLEHVRSLEDAKEANLGEKESLRELHLIWSDPRLQEENVRDVIEGLQPTDNLRRLAIEGYQGRKFPRWLDVSLLPKLVKIQFWRCTSCEHLPPLGSLPLLRALYVISMHSLKFINKHEMVNSYPSLKELEFVDLPMLEDWTPSGGLCGGEQKVTMLPTLRRLKISDCPRLKILPLSSYLEVLQLSACNNMVLQSLKGLPRLISLEITGFKEIVRFPERMLENLFELQSLVIDGCPDMESLPKQLEHISTLVCMDLRDLSSLTSLPAWIGNLKNLRHMQIYSCKNLTALPESLKHLSSLYIRNCNPRLHQRCSKRGGEDWH